VRTESLKNLTAMSDLKNAYASLKVSQNESLKALRVKLADLEAQVALNRTRLGDQHPDMLALVAQRDEMRANYLSQVKQLLPKGVSPQRVETSASGELSQELFGKLILSDIERPALESRLTLVQASRKQLQAQLQQLPQREQELVELMRQREVAASALSTLQNKLEEARVAEAQLIGNITIIDRATSTDKPKWPSKIVILIIAGVVGFILVVGIILILEALDGTLRNATEAESLLKMPVLGVLPILPSNAISMVKPDAFLGELNTVESFRTLLKTLEFRSYGKLKVIVVSSTLAQEGKSVVASHLASVAAMLSRNTLLIDADMRMPTQDTLFGLEQKPGLSDCLVGRVSLKQIINETAMENLAVITAGQMHPQPSQLLESSRLKVLLAEASRYFDLIIIDSPPLTSCSDAATLSSYSDGLLMIARPNFTPKDLLQKAIADLQTNHCNVLGVAINGMNAQTELYYRGSRKMLTS
jgi:polysaccharide biosynthesis transport protein